MMNELAIDVGGTHVKVLAAGQKEERKFESGPSMWDKSFLRSRARFQFGAHPEKPGK
jgi:hypothetical protein